MKKPQLSAENISHHIARMFDCDARITNEVALVQRKYGSNTMNQHRSNQPRIMHLGADNRVCLHETPPLGINLFVIRQQRKRLLNFPNASLSINY